MVGSVFRYVKLRRTVAGIALHPRRGRRLWAAKSRGSFSGRSWEPTMSDAIAPTRRALVGSAKSRAPLAAVGAGTARAGAAPYFSDPAGALPVRRGVRGPSLMGRS